MCKQKSAFIRNVRQGRENLYDEVRPGRPPIDFLDIGMLALLDEQPFHSAYLIDKALSVSRSTTLSHLRESLGMKNFIYVGSRTSQRPVCDRFG
jgi:hypothetical protein